MLFRSRLIPSVDRLYVFDNSPISTGPVLLAAKPNASEPLRLLHPNRIPEIDAVLIANGALTP